MWIYINEKVLDLKEKHVVTAQDIRNAFSSASDSYRCDPNTFPPIPGPDWYELGGGDKKVVPYNEDCYKISLSSGKTEDDRARVLDTTFKNDPEFWFPSHLRSNNITDKIGLQEKWVFKDISEVLNAIYEYSNKTYGKYGEESKVDADRKVGRIRVDTLNCLRYSPDCIIGECLLPEKDVQPSVSFEDIKQSLDEKITIGGERTSVREIMLYSASVYDPNPVGNMEHWRIDSLQSRPEGKSPDTLNYDTYFKNLEIWAKTEKDPKNLQYVYEYLTRRIYRSLLLEAIDNANGNTRWKDYFSPEWEDILRFNLRSYLTGGFLKLWRRSLAEKSICNICRTTPGRLTLDNSVCQEYLIKTLIFLKLQSLGSMVKKELVDLEKMYLISWLNFVKGGREEDDIICKECKLKITLPGEGVFEKLEAHRSLRHPTNSVAELFDSAAVSIKLKTRPVKDMVLANMERWGRKVCGLREVTLLGLFSRFTNNEINYLLDENEKNLKKDVGDDFDRINSISVQQSDNQDTERLRQLQRLYSETAMILDRRKRLKKRKN